MAEFVVFRLEATNIGLRASTIERVVHAVEVTPLPRAPDIALGVINVRGTMVPVVNLRKRLGLSDRELALSDLFVIARTTERSLAIVADSVDGVFEYAESAITDPSTLLPGIEQIAGIANRKDGIIFIHDLDLFLSLNEAASLDSAIATQGSEPGGNSAS